MGEGEKDYKVLFVSEQYLPRPLEPGTIVITPSSDSWNDFGERILIEVFILSRKEVDFLGDPLIFRAFFGLLEEKDGRSDTLYLRGLTDRSPDPIEGEDLLPYFTMLPDMESYRRIVGHLGADEARLALSAMNDMVAANDRPAGKSWLKAACGSKVFLNAFLRQSEAYFTWKNAAPILRGIEYEELDRISNGVRIKFQLAGRPNAHDIKFNFALGDKVLPQRFAILIGKNGVGKSQTLSQIVASALRGNPQLTDLEGGRPLFNRILAFYPSASMSSVFPSDRVKRARVWYRRFSMVSGRPRQSTGDLVVQLARSVEGIAGQTRYQIFLNAIRTIDGSDELVLRTNSADRGPVPISNLNRGGEQLKLERYASIKINTEPVRLIEGKTYPLSSGELSFLRFAALVALYVENGTLFLFDEPETHLHPSFISQFVALLDDLLEQTGSAAILATHSVYFVREAMEDQVTVLRSDPDRMISTETPRLKTFGADVGAISYFVFGEDQPSRLAQEVESKILAESMSWEEIFEAYKDRVSLELLGELRARAEETDLNAGGQ